MPLFWREDHFAGVLGRGGGGGEHDQRGEGAHVTQCNPGTTKYGVPPVARWAAVMRPRAESAHPRGGAVAKVLSTMRPAERRRPCQINIRGRVKLRTFGWHTP